MHKTSTTSPTSGRNMARALIFSYITELSPRDAINVSAEMVRGQSDANEPEGMVIGNARAHQIVKRGISSRALEPLADYLGLGKGDVADYLDLDRGTAHRRATKDMPLPDHAAEGVLRLLELDQMAKATFATEADAAGWLRAPHPMLDGDTPLAAAKTSFGAERVKEILVALKWGGVV